MKNYVPLVWQYGLNSGVLFMKLDRLREFDFEKKVMDVTLGGQYSIIGDQDFINIVFHNQTG